MTTRAPAVLINQEMQKKGLPLVYLAFSQTHLLGTSNVLAFILPPLMKMKEAAPLMLPPPLMKKGSTETRTSVTFCLGIRMVWSPVRIFGHIEN